MARTFRIVPDGKTKTFFMGEDGIAFDTHEQKKFAKRCARRKGRRYEHKMARHETYEAGMAAQFDAREQHLLDMDDFYNNSMEEYESWKHYNAWDSSFTVRSREMDDDNYTDYLAELRRDEIYEREMQPYVYDYDDFDCGTDDDYYYGSAHRRTRQQDDDDIDPVQERNGSHYAFDSRNNGRYLNGPEQRYVISIQMGSELVVKGWNVRDILLDRIIARFPEKALKHEAETLAAVLNEQHVQAVENSFQRDWWV